MTNFWFLVTVTGVLIILIALVVTPSPVSLVYLIGAAMAATGVTVSILREIDGRHRG